METIIPLLTDPVGITIICALVLFLFYWGNVKARLFSMKREIRRAEKTCQAKIDESDRAMATFLKSHTRAQQSLQTECEELREKNNRLESLFNHLSSDPDKNLRRQLEIYEFALEDLRTNAPGFAPAWQHSLERANEAMAEGELGLLRWMPRSLLPNKEEKRGWFGRRLKQAEAVEVEVE